MSTQHSLYTIEIVGKFAIIRHWNGERYVTHPRTAAILVTKNPGADELARIERIAERDSEHFQAARAHGFPAGWARLVHDVVYEILNHGTREFSFAAARVPGDTVYLALEEASINWRARLAIDDPRIEAFPVRINEYDVESINA